MYQSRKRDDGTYSAGNFLARGFELVSPKLVGELIDQYLPDYKLPGRIKIALDVYWCVLRYGAIPYDYFEYGFWVKKACIRKTYVTKMINIKIKRALNREPTGIFRNKLLFNEKFYKFRNLRFIDINEASVDEFLDFVKSCNRNIIAKPLTGFSGIGIHKPDVSTDEKAKEVYKTLKDSGEYFCEEVFVQKGILGEINPASVNTVRIYTLSFEDKVVITFTGIRFGGGTSCVDNIHNNGMCCVIDKDSGYIVSPGYNLLGQTFYFHPVTQKMLLGVKIPRWDEVINIVTEAASLYQNQGYVAWDIAVSDDKISIIEGNDGGNFDLPQVCSQKGFKSICTEAIRGKKNLYQKINRAAQYV